MTDWTLLNPYWIPIAVLCALLARRIGHRAAEDSWSSVLSVDLLSYFRRLESVTRTLWNPSLLLAAFVAMILTAPSQRTHTDDTFQQSHGWLAIVDVSRSMTLTDVAPSRLGAVRNSLLDLSELSAGFPLSLILYSGDAFLVAPPAFDKRLFNEQVSLLEHGMVPVEGSNLARALSLADAVIRDSEFISTRVFVFSDGGGITKSSIAAAHHLSDAGHRVDLIVAGSTTDGQTPVDVTDIENFVNAGLGDLVSASSLGAIDIDKLSPKSWASADSQSLFQALIWRNHSHWLLLLLAPMLWWVLRDDFA